MVTMRKPLSPTPVEELIGKLPASRLLQIMTMAFNSPELKYYHWDTLRHLDPPAGLDHEEWWLVAKLARGARRKSVPLTDRQGNIFSFSIPDEVTEYLHRVDQQTSGAISISEAVTNPATRDRYVVNSLIEEAIISSQLEGASTSRRVAKDMIRSGRAPKDRDEQMILNNYRAMQYVGDLRSEKLRPAMVLELHRIVTEGTLDTPGAAGRLQTPDEERVKVWDEDKILHEPPDAAELPGRLKAMCDFANESRSGLGFVHPVLRAIILHFWLAYDHPFEDGNGRTARALFYWSMLNQGYWLTEFVTISRILRKAPAKYARSFLYTETDDNDLTYFILYQLNVFMRAANELKQYLARKMSEVRDADRLIRNSAGLNHRQLALLSHALRSPDAQYTVASHQRSHRVSYETARSDLLALVDRGVLQKRRIGHAYYFTPVQPIAERLQDLP